MRKLLLLFLAIVLFSVSCATYTIEEAREIIAYPSYDTLTPTKLSVIEEKQRLLEEEARKKEIENAVNEYPEDISSIALPFYYNPVKNKDAKVEKELKAALLPLGEAPLTDSEIHAIGKCLEDGELNILALTGSRLNQARLTEYIGYDAITLEGGTVVINGVVPSSMEKSSLTLSLGEEREIVLFIEDQKPLLPSEGDVDEVLSLVSSLEERDIEDLVEYVSQSECDKRLFFLSSYAPSSSDWSDWTAYDYRRDEEFMTSSLLESLKWIDAYSATHYSVETDPGYTRKNGEIEERLDFIYSKGIIPTSSFTLPIENTHLIAVVASFLLPY